MKKRKIWVSIALASACLFSLAACGKTEEPTPTPTPTATPTATPTPTPAPSSTPSATPSASSSSVQAAQGYTITFDANGKTVTDLPEALADQTAIPANLTGLSDIAGSKFIGWGLEATSTTPVEEGTAIESATTLYAIWQSSISMNGTNYATIDAALKAIPATSTDTYTISLPKGTYSENDLSYKGSATIKIVGDTTTKYGADVIISGHGTGTSNKTRCTIEIEGTGNVVFENVTIINDWSRSVSEKQAEALGTDTTGYTVAYNCAFKSHQDTIRTVSKSWFYGCYIEGDTDFIWMEASSVVALYEKCEIVSVYDEIKGASDSYIAAPKTNVTSKVGKGLVVFNSVVKESDEAIANGQKTYLARTPWSSGCYNQVAYINTTCSNIETGVWYKTAIATEYPKTVIGWKMDQATATSLGYTGNEDILDADTVSKEFNGRRAILNRLYNTAKGKYEKDTEILDIDAIIEANGFVVDEDTSKTLLDGETESSIVTYLFDGTENDKVASMCNGFAQETGKTHYVGNKDATITIPVTGKCTVTVSGYFSGYALAKAGTQGECVMDFNNSSTSKINENVYVVYDSTVENVVIKAASKTYITKIVVEYDDSIVNVPVTGITVNASSSNYTVGVALNLKATVNPTAATNSSVKWSSSDDTIATIDEYSGKVAFKKAGEEVTFTATACDGSGITGTFTCTAVEATWTACEWYTKDDTVATETGAEGISNFSTNSSTSKALTTSQKFKNLSGDEITTSKGLKLNADGKLTISTTAEATLTLIIAPAGKTTEVPLVSNGTDTIAGTATTSGELTTVVYRITKAGTWDITRAGGSEVNPILYAKCVYDAIWDFKKGSPSGIESTNIEGKTGTVASNHAGVVLNVDATNGKLAGRTGDSAQFNSGTIIKVPVKYEGSVITVVGHSGYSHYSIGNIADADDNQPYTVTAADVTAGYVEIVSTGAAYLCSISLTNPR